MSVDCCRWNESLSHRRTLGCYRVEQGRERFRPRLLSWPAGSRSSSDSNFWAVGDPNEQVASAAARLGQAFAGNPNLLASPNPGWDRHTQGTIEAADIFGPALGCPIVGDSQVASKVGSPHFESGIRTGFDPNRHHASTEIAFSGNAKTGTRCSSGRNLQRISLSPLRIGGVLHPDL